MSRPARADGVTLSFSAICWRTVESTPRSSSIFQMTGGDSHSGRISINTGLVGTPAATPDGTPVTEVALIGRLLQGDHHREERLLLFLRQADRSRHFDHLLVT